MPYIELRNVSLVYDTPSRRVPGVENVSFGIEPSEFLCIVGPSGCGKSTLLNMIAGFLKPTGGEIRIGGKPVTGHGLDRGIVFQDFAQLFPWRTALGNVAFGLEMKGIAKAEREEIAALDALTRDDMQRLLAEVWRETRKTIVYVTHNVAEAVFLADRVVVMTPHPGTVKTEVPIRLTRPRDPLSVEFLEHQKELLRHLGGQAARA
jgi:NitT/TauT family transport system ATP-binding protein